MPGSGARWGVGTGPLLVPWGACPSPRVRHLPTVALRCRFCGERPQFVVASQSSRITVRLHSDQSYTDTGFLAEYQSYDSHDREWLSGRRSGLEGGAWGALSALHLLSMVLSGFEDTGEDDRPSMSKPFVK